MLDSIEGKHSYKRVFEDKDLPPYWAKRFKLLARRFRSQYRKKGISDYIIDEILEQLAFCFTYLKWIQSPDFRERVDEGLEIAQNRDNYLSTLKMVTKLVENMFKYVEPKKTVVRKKKVAIAGLTKNMNDKELNEAIQRIISNPEGDSENLVIGEATETETKRSC